MPKGKDNYDIWAYSMKTVLNALGADTCVTTAEKFDEALEKEARPAIYSFLSDIRMIFVESCIAPLLQRFRRPWRRRMDMKQEI